MVGADSFGCALKDTIVSHLHSLNIKVKDLGTSTYYSLKLSTSLPAAQREREREREREMFMLLQKNGFDKTKFGKRLV